MNKLFLVLILLFSHGALADTITVWDDPDNNYAGRFEKKSMDDGYLRIIIDHATGCEYFYVEGRSIAPVLGGSYAARDPYCPSENKYTQQTDNGTKAYRK
ncbi:hypothetical protein MOA67_gp213 [Klebsiella phage KpLz-2_45]|uniref:hypothetical protein n=1 Tax=Klebsiella phage KpLz-2_45 TaxID=2698923 RepID=UPI001F12F93D|nr:hypothetical protein MOA67_gp213 [Klebsiella phage KpLz-2_45]UKS72210.1 hypothetical protein KpLz245_3440 [Klebsiella phage KpLz-2_45]